MFDSNLHSIDCCSYNILVAYVTAPVVKNVVPSWDNIEQPITITGLLP